MAVNKRFGGLGKGLDSIIQDKGVAAPAESASKDGAVLIDINKIQRNKQQPRKKFDEGGLEELALSIKQHGVIQPVILKDRGDHYEIVAGERRYRACIKAGLTKIPAIIKDYTDQEIAEIALIENLQREDLDPIEEAQAYKRLKTEYKLTDDEISEKVSKSRSAVTNSLRLLNLSAKVQQLLIEKKLTMGHARALLAVDDEAKQYELAEKIINEKLSVRETEKLISGLGNEAKEKPEKKEDPEMLRYKLQYDNYADKLSAKLGAKVSVNLKNKTSGKIELTFTSTDEFEKFYELLNK